MLKPIIAATAFLVLAGSTFVYAQQGFGGRGFDGPGDGPGRFGDGGPRAEVRHRPSAADMAAFTDARIAAMKAGLELTADQSKNWPAFEQAVRDMAQLRIQNMQAREAEAQPQPQQTPGSPFDRLARRADNMAKRSAALKKVADAGAPLYQSLDDAQKGRFMVLARILRPHRGMHGFMRQGMMEHGMMGQGSMGQGFMEHGWRQDGPRFGHEQGQDQDGDRSQL